MEQKNYYANLKCSHGYIWMVSNGNNEKFPCQDFSTSLINFNEMNLLFQRNNDCAQYCHEMIVTVEIELGHTCLDC